MIKLVYKGGGIHGKEKMMLNIMQRIKWKSQWRDDPPTLNFRNIYIATRPV